MKMNQLPNPFLAEDHSQPQQSSSRALTSQDFLLMTPVSTAQTPRGGQHRGGKNRGRGYFTSPWRSPPAAGSQGTGFIPFSSGEGVENSASRNQDRRGRGGGGGGGHRYSYPYQHSPQHQNQGFSPQRHGFGQQRHHGNGGDRNGRGSGRKLQYGNKREERAPLSSIPIEKFISQSMLTDPWAEFFDDESSDVAVGKLSPVTLDDSEIIIDSDASVIIESSYEEGNSGTEGDSSPLIDTGSDSPCIATPSTSEKDTGSDSLSDA